MPPHPSDSGELEAGTPQRQGRGLLRLPNLPRGDPRSFTQRPDGAFFSPLIAEGRARCVRGPVPGSDYADEVRTNTEVAPDGSPISGEIKPRQAFAFHPLHVQER